MHSWSARAGKVVAHPDERSCEGGLCRRRPGRPARRPSVQASPEGFTTVRVKGQDRRIYWAASPLTGWKTVLDVSERAVLGPVSRQRLYSAMIGLAGLLLMVLIVTQIARRLARPLLNLTGAAAAIEQGSFREEMLGELPRRDDELGELSRSVRKMAREIKFAAAPGELNQGLERTVHQRNERASRGRRAGAADPRGPGASRPGVTCPP